MYHNSLKNSWQDKISNPHQLGGIESSILENGRAAGSRVAWINTGSGLRYKVLKDRSLDIADAFYNQYSLAWISHLGITAPNPALHGMRWLESFGGGLLTTCGLTHTGGPEKDEYGDRGLHDKIHHMPAEIESVIQPDPDSGKFDMSITGTMLQSTPLGQHLKLNRTLSSRLGEAGIKIHDEVTNLGNESAPHMILYHFNLGWPLVDQGTRIFWEGKWQSRGGEMDNRIFYEGGDFKTCREPAVEHNGSGEACVFIDTDADEEGRCLCGLMNEYLQLALVIRFSKHQLPWLTNWQHWGKNEYVTGLEPGTHPPTGQAKARKEGNLILLEPGESRKYELELEIYHADQNLEALEMLKQTALKTRSHFE